MSGNIVTVTDETFDAVVLNSEKPVLVDFWAEWCGPCRQVAPVLEQIADEYANEIVITKLNVDDNPATASRFGIVSIPTMKVFSRGEQVVQVVGAKPKSALLQDLRPVLETNA